MPVNQKLMDRLKKSYGKDAEKIYYSLENNMKKK